MSVTLTTARERALHAWECTHVDPHDTNLVGPEVARAVAQHVWQRYAMPGRAPDVQPVGPEDAGYISGAIASWCPTTMVVHLHQPAVATSVILHELAHVFAEDPLDRVEMRRLQEEEVHGDVWLGCYLDLLDKFMGPSFNKLRLMATLPPGRNPGWAPRIWGVQRVVA